MICACFATTGPEYLTVIELTMKRVQKIILESNVMRFIKYQPLFCLQPSVQVVFVNTLLFNGFTGVILVQQYSVHRTLFWLDELSLLSFQSLINFV